MTTFICRYALGMIYQNFRKNRATDVILSEQWSCNYRMNNCLEVVHLYWWKFHTKRLTQAVEFLNIFECIECLSVKSNKLTQYPKWSSRYIPIAYKLGSQEHQRTSVPVNITKLGRQHVDNITLEKKTVTGVRNRHECKVHHDISSVSAIFPLCAIKEQEHQIQ